MEWMNMNGHGVYVWPCYLITLVVLAGNLLWARYRHRALLQEIGLRSHARSRGSRETRNIS